MLTTIVEFSKVAFVLEKMRPTKIKKEGDTVEHEQIRDVVNTGVT
jgi:hypothetical protein